MRLSAYSRRVLYIGGFLFLSYLVVFTFLVPINAYQVERSVSQIDKSKCATEPAIIQDEGPASYDAAIRSTYHLMRGDREDYDRVVTWAKNHQDKCVVLFDSYKLYL